MKKFTYISVALLASVLALASCGNKGDTSAPTSGPTSTTVTPTTAPVTPAVNSVTVSPKTSTLNLQETLTLAASVSAVGGASTAVAWTSSDSTVASVSASGLVTALKEGTATITATSTFDSTKSDSAVITVVDKGFAPELYDEGYTYSKTWPEAAIKSFIGTGDYSVLAPADTSKGAYYDIVEGTGNTYSYAEVIVDGDQYDSYLEAAELAGFHVWVELVWGIFPVDCAIDPSKTYEVDPYQEYDEDYENVLYTSLTFYRTSELFAGDKLTTNENWTNEEKAEFEKVTGLAPIPFVALGEEYEVEAMEGEEEGVYEAVEVCDYSLAYDALAGYGEVLTGAGYSYDEENDVYYKPFASKPWLQQVVEFSWCSTGNTIYTYLGNVVYESFPSELIDSFTSHVLGSKFKVPAIEGANADQFLCDAELDGEEPYAYLEAYSYSYNEFKAYAATLEDAGYEVELIEQTDEEYGYIAAEKGKIALEMQYINDFDYETYEFSDESGEIDMYIFQGFGYEDPGIYLPVKSLDLAIGKTYQIEPVLFEIMGDVSYTTSDANVATVSATGLVTSVAEGDATITATVNYNDHEYSATIDLHAYETQYFVKVVNNLEDYTGQYLIVCEDEEVALDSSLTAIDAVSNVISVEIDDNKIEATKETVASSFTIESNGSGTYSILGANGNYIGNVAENSNGLKTSKNASDYKNTISVSGGVASIKCGQTFLKFNPATGQDRFRYYKSTSQNMDNISLYKLEA